MQRMNDEERQRVLAGARPDTRAVRSGQVRTAEGEHSEALFLTSSYVFGSAADAAARFAGGGGNVYSRYTNPTVRVFEERIATLEGAAQAVATASGMAAILAACMSLLESGSHLLCSRDVFGSTTMLLNRFIAKFGVDVDYVDATDYAAWEAALRPRTRMLFLETPSNPLCEVVDIERVAAIAKAHGALLVVDNCFLTPVLQQPLALGADVVVHSATKYIDGQGRCLGGALCGSRELMEQVVAFQRSAGPCMSPFNAWVFLKGLETLRIRMEAHSRSALELAHWLQRQPGIVSVNYPGLPTHPQHALACRQQRGFGGVLSFTVEGGRDAAWRFMDATRLMSITANLGDAKTTIVHPATTTHGRLTEQERSRQGIVPGLVRVAVGLEDPADLREDLARGLYAASDRSAT
ncbi:MAG: O-succinylhomoserine sulfhydrylase [Pseudomonadales bacterium]|jgi:O-succinylhomoserine sulfhydrylase|nr:O-succinylhomoserine sulfhydrylase [Pseudomonadales bacterium]